MEFLRSDDQLGGTGNQPIYRGKRAADLSRDNLIQVLKASGCPTREIELAKPFKPGKTFQKTYRAPCWVVGEGTGTTQRYEERVPVSTMWAVLATGEICAVTNYFAEKHFQPKSARPLPRRLEAVRKERGGCPAVSPSARSREERRLAPVAVGRVCR